MSSVTVITASTGRDSLMKCVESVSNQSGAELGKVQHLILSDGPEANQKTQQILYKASAKQINGFELIKLPYAVGKDRWNGHRMYGAGTFLAEGDYVTFLDDDNWFDPNHLNQCVKAIHESPRNAWAFSLRKIVSQDGNFLCNDDCESLGNYPTVMSPNDHLVDVNCYFLRKDLAIQLSPIWYRKAREPNVMEVDRALIAALLHNQVPGACTGQYTVNYAVGGNALSVAPDFFIQGNAEMTKRYNGDFPWRKK
jgi:hypothetical protein